MKSATGISHTRCVNRWVLCSARGITSCRCLACISSVWFSDMPGSRVGKCLRSIRAPPPTRPAASGPSESIFLRRGARIQPRAARSAAFADPDRRSRRAHIQQACRRYGTKILHFATTTFEQSERNCPLTQNLEFTRRHSSPQTRPFPIRSNPVVSPCPSVSPVGEA